MLCHSMLLKFKLLRTVSSEGRISNRMLITLQETITLSKMGKMRMNIPKTSLPLTLTTGIWEESLGSILSLEQER